MSGDLSQSVGDILAAQDREKVADLTVQLDSQQRLLEDRQADLSVMLRRADAAEAMNGRLMADLTTIAGALRDEALARDWCDVYDAWVADVNTRCSSPWLLPCPRELEFNYEVTIRATVAHEGYAAVSERLKNILLNSTDNMRDVEDLDITVYERK